MIRGAAIGRILVVAALLLGLLATPTHAEPTPTAVAATGPVVGMHLVHQDAWVGTSGQFTMLLHVDDAKLAAQPNASIAIQIHERASTRSGFDQAVANQDPGALGGVLDQPNRIPVASLPRLGGNLAVTLGLPGSNVRPAISVTKPGAYPVEVSLTDTGTPTAPFVTWLVVVDTRSSTPIEKPLMVSWIWQLLADPATLPDGGVDPDVVAQMRPGGRLDHIATVLDRAGRFPYSLIAGPETVETWSKVAQLDPRVEPGFARVRAAAQRRTTDLLPATYVPIDATVLEAAGLGDHLADEYTKGGETLQSVLHASPSTQAQTAFVEPVDGPVVDRLRRMPITHVAVRDPALVPVTHPFTPAQAFVLVAPEGRSAGVSTAPFIETMLDGPDAPAIKAARIVAALAEIAYETPAIARGVVLAPPRDWSPNVTTMTAVVGALRDLPLVQPVGLNHLFGVISTEHQKGVDVERTLAPVSPGAPTITVDQYAQAQSRLDDYAAVVGDNDQVVVDGRHTLLESLSSSLAPARVQATLARIATSINSFASAVTVDAKRVTLTARKADIPLSFENRLKPARTIRVRVHLESPKLTFPKGADQVVPLGPGTTTQRFTVEARSSGTFPMTISLTSPDQRFAFGTPVRVSVRSAVFGGFAVALTVAAFVFLAGWWGNHFRKTRRARRLAAAVT